MIARLPNLSAESRETFWRSLQTLNGTRVVIAVVLLAYLSFDPGSPRSASSFFNAQICAVYLFLSVVFTLAAARWRRRFMLQLASQLACDLTVISLLYFGAGGVRSGLAILYLFPLAGCAILAPLMMALFAAAIASLFVLAEGSWRMLVSDGEMTVVQAGLYGAAFFAAVLVVNRMAARLIGQEELAVQRGIEVGVQQAVNRLVMSHAGDGVIVLGASGEVYASNPAAQQMLGLTQSIADFRLSDNPSLLPVALAYDEWRVNPAQSSAFITVKPFNDPALQEMTAAWSARRDVAVHLKVRFAAADTAALGTERNVIFLQDVTAIENQAQQLKLASMGRLTASIAHEVRNPLSAIGHATSLMAEDLKEPVHVRLLKIISDNVARVNRMVEDILQLSRKAQGHSEPLELERFLAELKAEFDDTHGLAPEVLCLGGVARHTVRFDPLHLREVLLNLLNNAVRYASGKPESIRVFVVQARGRPLELHVQDDGPGISTEVRAHLFEPFYTTSSKGTGLGLYLARELCLNNEAMLDYEYRFDREVQPDGSRKSSGRFVITFALPPSR
ncbi:sensor histidine kinase [Massilia endophytica]|uniref:sensor histidine kinase n=1 Tax=Massilia endophytica TaxID=2899220 RepID=UPI001E29A208|nr:PAS domain-containing sensor histidine kinase [Massilia endophytica]UGQ45663.1 PAS domain-containing sensor histidine kinase [Massilia endophytica]